MSFSPASPWWREWSENKMRECDVTRCYPVLPIGKRKSDSQRIGWTVSVDGQLNGDDFEFWRDVISPEISWHCRCSNWQILRNCGWDYVHVSQLLFGFQVEFSVGSEAGKGQMVGGTSSPISYRVTPMIKTKTACCLTNPACSAKNAPKRINPYVKKPVRIRVINSRKLDAEVSV